MYVDIIQPSSLCYYNFLCDEIFNCHNRYGGGMSSAKAALESDTRVSSYFFSTHVLLFAFILISLRQNSYLMLIHFCALLDHTGACF